ncbi:MAG: hypothetical protein JWO59_3184 [Chloroflexi bacterium]|nr:hypothetical protein [Chloroflexota bacterium]
MTSHIIRQYRLPAHALSPFWRSFGLLTATAVMTLGVVQPVQALRAVIVLPFALLLPGYAMIAVIFGFQERFDVVPTLALSALLSLFSYMFVGLALNAAAIRLSSVSILAGIDALIALSICAAVLRVKAGLPPSQPGTPVNLADPRKTLWTGAPACVMLVTGLSIVTVVVLLTMTLLPQPAGKPYTQFYLTGPWSKTASVITVPATRSLTVTVGINNRTSAAQTYRITPFINGAQSWNERTIALTSGSRWSGSVTGIIPADGCLDRLRINLGIRGRRGALASLIVWVRAAGSQASCKSTSAADTP